MLDASGIQSFTQFEADCNITSGLIQDVDRSVNWDLTDVGL